MGRGIGGHQQKSTPKRDTYISPRDLLRRLGPFGLDPCEALKQPWPCAPRAFNIRIDGLKQKWDRRLRVWCNPPYSNPKPFMERLRDHGNGIALLFGRIETELWHRLLWQSADGVLFLQGRLTFFRPSGLAWGGNSGGPSALIAYGENNVEKLRTCGLAGALVTEWKMQDGITGPQVSAA